jgi:hypothetical protein
VTFHQGGDGIVREVLLGAGGDHDQPWIIPGEEAEIG